MLYIYRLNSRLQYTGRGEVRMTGSRVTTVTGCVLAMVVVAAAIPSAVHPRVNLLEPLERDEVINAVNNAKTTWVAGRNFKSSLTKQYLKNLMGVLMEFEDPSLSKAPVANTADDVVDDVYIPAEYDVRSKYPSCTIIQEVRDQGPCGSCWAVSAVSSFSDRLCIASKGRFNTHLSAGNLLSCCCCCSAQCGQGCLGGYPDRAWGYFQTSGIPTGGDYHSKEGCQPYPLPPCEHHVPGPRPSCSSFNTTTPTCSQECYNKRYKNHTYTEDMHKVKYAVELMGAPVKLIQKEILKHGPVTAAFRVYEDFLNYKSGVYQHVSGEAVGGHAVKIIGWGVDNDTPYWLVTNSWNTDWGDNGFFKIKRGTNECFFESHITFGYPEVPEVYGA